MTLEWFPMTQKLRERPLFLNFLETRSLGRDSVHLSVSQGNVQSRIATRCVAFIALETCFQVSSSPFELLCTVN